MHESARKIQRTWKAVQLMRFTQDMSVLQGAPGIGTKEGAHVREADRSTWPSGYIGNVESATQPKPPLG